MPTADDLIVLNERGLYCPQGDFYIDPWQPVSRAIITHAHADHARVGSAHYLAALPGKSLLQTRLGEEANIAGVPYGEVTTINGVQVSLHPAGHILGSAQVKISYRGKTWVISGDYKIEPDLTCAPFEPVRCHIFISEATFALPIYVWKPQQLIFDEINAWWRQNKAQGKTSILLGYSLGKAQRIMSGLNPELGHIYTHGAVERLTHVYREGGVQLPPTFPVSEQKDKTDYAGHMVIAPPSAFHPIWLKRFNSYAVAFASGWMRVRGARRLRNYEQGFVLSDHADWPGLLYAIKESNAEEVLITHGHAGPIVRYLNESGIIAHALDTRLGERSADDNE